MITFDKLKIVAGINAIKVTDEACFESIMKNGVVSSLKYYQEHPFLLMIKVDYKRMEVVIEFSGKVLGKDYPKLISKNTIKQCFQAIEALGLVEVNSAAMMEAKVVKCDVTKDILFDDVTRGTNYVRSHIKSYHQFQCHKYRKGNAYLENNVESKKAKKRMTIYDKGKEMSQAANRPFVEKYGLENVFNGMCRFELNLKIEEQIRKSLRIADNRLITVLASTADPITDFLDEVVEPQDSIMMSDKKSYMTMLVLRDCEFDLEKVEAKMRTLYKSRGTSIRKVMEPYKAMMEQIYFGQQGDNLWNEIRGKLTECIKTSTVSL